MKGSLKKFLLLFRVILALVTAADPASALKTAPSVYLEAWNAEKKDAEIAAEAQVPKTPNRWFESCRAPSRQKQCELSAKKLQDNLRSEINRLNNQLKAYQAFAELDKSHFDEEPERAQEKKLRREIQGSIELLRAIRDELGNLFPLYFKAPLKNENSLFTVRYLAEGPNCFFETVAEILRHIDNKPYTAIDVRKQMAEFLLSRATQEQRKHWDRYLQDIRHNGGLIHGFYDGVLNTKDLANRILNAPPFKGVYKGDELFVEIAENTFDLSLILVLNIKANLDQNYFVNKEHPVQLRNRFAFLRYEPGNPLCDFQVHAFRGAQYAFKLGDSDTLPFWVKRLVDVYLMQYSYAPRFFAKDRHGNIE